MPKTNVNVKNKQIKNTKTSMNVKNKQIINARK